MSDITSAPQSIKIYIGTTFIKLSCNRRGILPSGVSIAEFVAKSLHERVWNPKLRAVQIVAKFVCFNEEDGCAYMPRYALDKLINYLSQFRIPIEKKYIDPITPRKIEMSMKPSVELRPVQVPICEFLTDTTVNTFKPLALTTGGGKALINGTLVRTVSGWKAIEKLTSHDRVISVDGTPTKVKGVFPQGKKSMYLVEFADGRRITTSEDHLWTVNHNGAKKVLSTSDIQQGLVVKEKFSIPLISGYDFGVPLPKKSLDPYILGAVLSRSNRQISGRDILVYLESRRPEVYNHFAKSIRNVKEEIVSVYQALTSALNDLNLRGRCLHIPDEYLNASKEERYRLLQGLIDNRLDKFTNEDHSTGIKFSNENEQLMKDVRHLVRSLGGKCYTVKVTSHRVANGFTAEINNSRDELRIYLKNPETAFKYAVPDCTSQDGDFDLPIVSITNLNVIADCTCISVDHPSQLFVAGDYIVTHNTVCAIYSAVKLGYPTLIVLQGLIDQWLNSIFTFTTLERDDVYVIKGFDSLKNLWKMIENGYRPKILICSTRTLSIYCEHDEKYASYQCLPSYGELCTVLGIGTKIIDECHLNFYTNCQIDLRSNILVNIYLSATYQRSSTDGRRIFNMYFPQEMKFGGQFIKKYTTVFMVRYHLCIPTEDKYKFVTDRGYNQAKYEKYIYRRPKYMNIFVEEVIIPLVYGYFVQKAKEGQHCLILVKTRDFAIDLHKRMMKKLVSDKSSAVFFSGDPGEYGDEDNLNRDIIVSTINSCGTGRDIKGLKTCICAVSMNSQPQALQCLGRLREIPGEDVFYMDLFNEEILSHANHAAQRSTYYRERVKGIYELRIR